ncbi:MAG: heavy metal translocating P-type ATPase metal-binding domain-containing protein [Chitinophagales bacterium]|nr:heavy metal translocating P-type ATPase metal-binding domain-containing protein [Bacteroidota bacterium]MCB9044299.1 heavy metal translocating P-type ATPase metal-binding domain-containing protein [Chitinophagales bacterium]
MSHKLPCQHCNSDCVTKVYNESGEVFCCTGCKQVYEILQNNNLCDYYRFQEGTSKVVGSSKLLDDYRYLDTENIRKQLLRFQQSDKANVSFYLPTIHCSACVWLLERLPQLQQGVLQSKIDFLRKEVDIWFNPAQVQLSEIAFLLGQVGYEPKIDLESVSEKASKNPNRDLYLRIGVAGFCFGNIMLASFPTYLDTQNSMEPYLMDVFSYVSFALALVVVVYAAAPYWKAAFMSLKMRHLDLNIPIVLGMSVLFLRSTYEVFIAHQASYFDTLAGFVFFMLLGKWFQQKSYDNLRFDRDYKSFFPLSARKKINDKWIPTPITQLQKGDEIQLQHGDLVPADAVLQEGIAQIDYSFVTGESERVQVNKGDLLYAGGRQMGGKISLLLEKALNQSYLIKLWQEVPFQSSNKPLYATLTDKISKIFVPVVLSISVIVGIYWYFNEVDRMWEIISAVLIITCPCALLLSSPIIWGNILRLLAAKGILIKDTQALEQLSDIDFIVFDKTGTLTEVQNAILQYEGAPLSEEEKSLIAMATVQSGHPMSRSIFEKFKTYMPEKMPEDVFFEERVGAGIHFNVARHYIFIGKKERSENGTIIVIDGKEKGVFLQERKIRTGIKSLINTLKGLHYKIAMLSGDGVQDEKMMEAVFGENVPLKFACSPYDKLNFIREKQEKNHKVMMIGDGLNDAGALKQSDFGLAISEQNLQFSPASHAIIEGNNLVKMPEVLAIAKGGKKLIYGALLISLLYNVVGIYVASSGMLSPLFAAIIMPLSSVSVVIYGMLGSNILVKKYYSHIARDIADSLTFAPQKTSTKFSLDIKTQV